VKLLLDQNLSPRLCGALRDLWAEIIHVRDVGLQAAEDLVVWEYAAKHGLTIISKDGDFNNLSFLFGAPPKVVWVQLGNCSTRDIEALLRARHADVLEFAGDRDSALLALGPTSTA
jgi:predicted nuclease of predicted toxin-antitoxin system